MNGEELHLFLDLLKDIANALEGINSQLNGLSSLKEEIKKTLNDCNR